MDIRFVSSLTSEDEKLFAPALLKALPQCWIIPIAYTVRIETTGLTFFNMRTPRLSRNQTSRTCLIAPEQMATGEVSTTISGVWRIHHSVRDSVWAPPAKAHSAYTLHNFHPQKRTATTRQR